MVSASAKDQIERGNVGESGYAISMCSCGRARQVE
jgi:hypothetical protein